MGRGLRTVRAWMAAHNDASAHLIFLINAGVALIVGAAAAVEWQLTIAWGLAVAVAAFGALSSCLLSRRAATIVTLAGSSLVGLVAAYVGWAVFAGPAVSQLAACLGGATGFGLTFLLYRRFVRATTGAGDMEGRFAGTFNERDEQLRKGSGAATVVVAATDESDDDLRLTGLVVGGVGIDFLGTRREGETIADLRTGAGTASSRTLLRGRVSIHGDTLIVDLEGSPFGSYVFTGRRTRG